MRTEEDVNENRSISFPSRRESLRSRVGGAGAYFACCALAFRGSIAYADSFMFCGGNCRACVVVCPVFVWLGRHFICRASFSCRREYLHAYVVCLVMPVLLLLAVFLDPTVGVG